MPIVNYTRRPLIFNEIGKPINDLNMEEALTAAKLNFNVGICETRVRLEEPNKPNNFLLYKVPNSYATYRTDTNKVFAAVGAKYEVVQNSVALNFIEQICDYDKTVRIETAGCYKDGANMLVTAKFPDSLNIGNNDPVDKYLLFTNSHDGSGMIQCAVTNIRVICNNMLNQALRNATQSFSFKHTKNVHNAIMSAVESIRAVNVHNEHLEEAMIALSKIGVKDNNIQGFVCNLILNKEQLEYMKLHTNIHSADTDIISTKTKNKIITVLDTIEKGVGQEKHRGSVLWLYNGVSCYLNNVVEYKTPEERFEALTKKGAKTMNQRAFDLALSALKVA